jgi:ABC-type lipoprotein export system ATPase subunit
MSEPAIAVRGLHKSYRLGRVDLHVLRGLSFSVVRGEFACIVGASGSGKSTLLHLVGLLDRPSKGTIELAGVRADRLGAGGRNRFRCRRIGFVFQFYYLLPGLSVLDNTLLPARVDASVGGWLRRRRARRREAAELLDRFGLGDRLTHRPKELSGGERQRAAIARALINRPEILLADEPTGNLDSHTGARIMEVLNEHHRRAGQTILLVTHDRSLTRRADRVMELRDGRLLDG